MLRPFLLAVVAAGCHQPDAAVDMWVSHDGAYRTIFATGEAGPGQVEWSTNRIELAGAINETLSFRFAISPDRLPVEGPDLHVGSFISGKTRMDPAAVRLYRMHPVPIGNWPGWHIRSIPPAERNAAPLDVLVPVRAPRGGLPASLRPGQTYHFWADVAVPKGTPEGVYASDIALSAQGKTISTVEVQLTVWPFVLPDEGAAHVVAEVDHRALFAHHLRYEGRPYRLSVDDWRDAPLRGELSALLGSTMRRLQRHRLTPVLPELAPIVKITAQDAVTVDWGQYDEIVEPCLNGELFFDRVRLRYWPMPVRTVFPAALKGGTLWSQAHQRLLGAYLAECASHFAQRGWLERSYAIPPGVRGPGAGDVARANAFAALARRSSERIPLLLPLFPQDMRPYGWVGYTVPGFEPIADIWMPRAQFSVAEAMAAERSAGRRSWVRIDRPPYSGSLGVHARATDVRIVTWQAEELAAEVLYAGGINCWPKVEDGPDPLGVLQAEGSADRLRQAVGDAVGVAYPLPLHKLDHLLFDWLLAYLLDLDISRHAPFLNISVWKG